MDRRALPTETAIYSEPELAFAFFFFLALGFFGRALRFSALILRRKLLLPSSNACRRQLLANLRVLLEGVDKLLGLQAMKTLEKAITRTMNRNKQKVSDHASWRTNLTSLVVGVLPELSSESFASLCDARGAVVDHINEFVLALKTFKIRAHLCAGALRIASRTNPCRDELAHIRVIRNDDLQAAPLGCRRAGMHVFCMLFSFFFGGEEPECVIWKMDYGD